MGEDRDSTIMARSVAGQFASCLRIPPNAIGPDSDFFKDLGGDSLALLDAVAAIEQEYSVAIEIENLPIVTVSTIVAAIERGTAYRAGVPASEEPDTALASAADSPDGAEGMEARGATGDL